MLHHTLWVTVGSCRCSISLRGDIPLTYGVWHFPGTVLHIFAVPAGHALYIAFANAVALDNDTHVLRRLGIIGKELLGVLGQAKHHTYPIAAGKQHGQ